MSGIESSGLYPGAKETRTLVRESRGDMEEYPNLIMLAWQSKPVPVMAIQLGEKNRSAVWAALRAEASPLDQQQIILGPGNLLTARSRVVGSSVEFHVMGHTRLIEPGDWIVKSSVGAFAILRDVEFRRIYEEPPKPSEFADLQKEHSG